MRTDERRWILLRTFYQSWRSFHALFAEYERRVMAFAERYGVDRKDLALSPEELLSLFDSHSLQALRDGELAHLREISHLLFRGTSDTPDPFDNHVSNIYHEVSILKEEHWTVREQAMREDRKEYERYYREVNVFYPKRLKHVRNLYGKARRRLEALLPSMGRNQVIVRSIYLFGERLLRDVYGGGLEEFYGHMYPEGGALTGYVVVADSFREGGFGAEAAEAYGRALTVLDRRLAEVAAGTRPHEEAKPLQAQRRNLEKRRESALALT